MYYTYIHTHILIANPKIKLVHNWCCSRQILPLISWDLEDASIKQKFYYYYSKIMLSDIND